jgi:hypothetical protein
VVAEQPLEEADGEALPGGLGGEDGGGELLGVSGENHFGGAEEAEEGEGLGGLGGLVEEGEVELLVGEDAGVEAGEGDADDLGALEDGADGLALEGAGLVEEALGLGGGGAGVGEAGAAAALGALAAGVAEEGEGLVEELAGEDAVGVVLDDEVQGVLLEAGSDASGVADADGAQALVETEVGEVVDGGVAGGGAEEPVALGDGLGGDLGEDGALAGARGAVDEEEVLGGEGAGDGVELLGVEGAGGGEGAEGVEARGLVAEEDLALATGGALVEGLDALEAGADALVGDVVGDAVEAEEALVDEGRRVAVESEGDAGGGGAGDEGASGLLDFGAAGEDGDLVAVVETGGEAGPVFAGEGDEDAAAEADFFLDALEVEEGEALLGALLEGEALGKGLHAGALGVALEGEESTKGVEEGDVARHEGRFMPRGGAQHAGA